MKTQYVYVDYKTYMADLVKKQHEAIDEWEKELNGIFKEKGEVTDEDILRSAEKRGIVLNDYSIV